MHKLITGALVLTLMAGCSSESAGVHDGSTSEEGAPASEELVSRGDDDLVDPDQHAAQSRQILDHVCGHDKLGGEPMYYAAIGGQYNAGSVTNTYALAVEVLNPFDYTLTTSSGWGPPAHNHPWGGNWAGDIWRDAGGGAFGNTCGINVRMKTRAVQVPGGQTAHEVRARVLQEGFACASGVYNQGGYMQKIGIEARYNSTWYDLGWVLYAHLDNMIYNVGDVFNPYDAVLGTAFQGGVYGACWGSCHIHAEFKNTQGTSCYELLPPTSGVGVSSQIGVVGGNLAGGNCNVASSVNNADVQEASSTVPSSVAAWLRSSVAPAPASTTGASFGIGAPGRK